MTLIQTFETSISNESGNYAGMFFIVPKAAMDVNEVSWKIDTVGEILGLKILEPIYPRNLPRAMASLLWEKNPEDVLARYKATINMTSDLATSLFGEELLSFVEQVCFFDLIPFEESPFDLEPFIKLFTKASPVSLGAYAGWVAAGGTYWILVTMPAGMIIFGAAAGIAEGLRVRLFRWLKGEKPKHKDKKTHRDKDSEKPHRKSSISSEQIVTKEGDVIDEEGRILFTSKSGEKKIEGEN